MGHRHSNDLTKAVRIPEKYAKQIPGLTYTVRGDQTYDALTRGSRGPTHGPRRPGSPRVERRPARPR